MTESAVYKRFSEMSTPQSAYQVAYDRKSKRFVIVKTTTAAVTLTTTKELADQLVEAYRARERENRCEQGSSVLLTGMTA